MRKTYIFIFILLLLNNVLQAQVDVNNTDVSHYHINLTNIDFDEHSIEAFTDVEFSLIEDADQAGLHLLHLEIDSIKMADQLLSFDYDDTVISIDMDIPVKAKSTQSIRIYYHGNPVKDPSNWGGFYFSNQYAFNLGVGFEDVPHNYGRVWFPCVDNFTDRATYNFSIHTNMDSKAVCNGMLTDIDTLVNGSDSSLVHHWNMTDPIPTYLASFACGQYDVVEWTYEGIERDIPVQLYVYPNDSAQAMASFANLDTITSIYETLFGAYPWQRIGYVSVGFSSGAMEHATNIAIPTAAVNGNTTYESLFAHELAHHWFGDLITCHDAEEMWINEGWATYCETIHEEFLYGKESGKNYRRSAHKNVILSSHTDDGGWYALNAVPLYTTYGSTSYEKGGSVVHSLRDYMGDELFFSSVETMLEEKAMEDVSSEEMRDALSSISGIDLTDFFDNWVFKPGMPHYKLDSFNVVNNGGTYDITVWVKQQLYGRNTLSDGNIVNISFLDENYEIHEERMNFDGEFGEHTFTTDFNPLMLAIDMNEKCSDAKTSQNNIINSTGTKYFSNELLKLSVSEVEDSVFMYASHHWGAPSAMKTPVEGLILANHRYWHIDGDFDNGFTSTCEFSYSNSTSGSLPNLDSDFINNDLDSLRIMYRPDQNSDWVIVENQSNYTFTKKIKIDDLLPGEYALAIYDWDEYHSIDDNIPFEVSVYPNPSSGQVFIQADEGFDGSFYIMNALGHEILTAKLNSEKSLFNWQCNSASGLYYIVFRDKSGKQRTERVIIQK